MKRTFKLLMLTCIVVAKLSSPVRAQQCQANVTHGAGTQTVGCTDVTVTSAGDVALLGNPICGVGPYLIGTISGNGSYTFAFSQPLSSITFNVTAINNNFGSSIYEEVSVSVNGTPYFLDNAGDPGACFVQAVVTPTGTLAAPPEEIGMSDNVLVNGPINTLTIGCQGSGFGVVFTLSICCCLTGTDAGVINDSPLFLCPADPATVSEADQTLLDADDLLQYILFSNLSDTLGSIIATSNTPTFFFNSATMQTGVIYYIAAIAGNNLNGSVNLNDPCLDVSNAIQATWLPQPAVVFSVADPDICAGKCTIITAIFTGTAPFVLTYTNPASGSMTQTFSGSTGTFQVCTLVGSPPGSFVVQAQALEDAVCSCP